MYLNLGFNVTRQIELQGVLGKLDPLVQLLGAPKVLPGNHRVIEWQQS
jgi:hypothetical protein